MDYCNHFTSSKTLKNCKNGLRKEGENRVKKSDTTPAGFS